MSSEKVREKVRENRLRRMARRQGLSLLKSRRRDPLAIDYGGYMLVDSTSNSVVMGGDPFPHSATVDEVEAWLKVGRKGGAR